GARSSTARANSNKEPVDNNDNDYESGPAALTPLKVEGGTGAAPRDRNGDGDSDVIEVPAKRQRLEVAVEEERVSVEEGVAAAGGGGGGETGRRGPGRDPSSDGDSEARAWTPPQAGSRS
ncbi:hypothetical protein L249_5414, partial [Ophiocordyceps polyrhachis-furcata BCC 54312]